MFEFDYCYCYFCDFEHTMWAYSLYCFICSDCYILMTFDDDEWWCNCCEKCSFCVFLDNICAKTIPNCNFLKDIFLKPL